MRREYGIVSRYVTILPNQSPGAPSALEVMARVQGNGDVVAYTVDDLWVNLASCYLYQHAGEDVSIVMRCAEIFQP